MLVLLVLDIVAGTLLRIAEHAVRLADLAETRRVARLLIVGMIALREQPIDPMDGFELRARAYLQEFVVVDELIGHDYFAPMRFLHSA